MNIETISNQLIAADFSMSLEDMIKAGNYNWVNKSITAKMFLVEGSSIDWFEPKVFHFDRFISSEDAIAAFQDDRENTWEPAKIEHLLAYGAKNRDEQRESPIIGLGSVAEVHGDRCVPCLDRYGVVRGLGLEWWDGNWNGRYRFLAVRKRSLGV